MCGIVGYVGRRRLVPVVMEGLKRLEYRGYDSAGIVYLQDGKLQKFRSEGKLQNLENILGEAIGAPSHIGLGHTRWATHGAPTTENAHPHTDCTGELVVVHNGIIENYHSLRNELIEKGHRFASETDTEVLAHLIEEYLDGDLRAAVTQALTRVEGSYALGVLWTGMPDTLIAARNHSPLVLGVHEEEGGFIASDVPPLLPYTNQVIFLDDQELAVLRADSHAIYSLVSGEEIKKEVQTIAWNSAMAEKGGYKHFMLKEIYEQPSAIADAIRGRLEPGEGVPKLGGIMPVWDKLMECRHMVLVACGTSYYAACVGKYIFEKLTEIDIEVGLASEFRYRKLNFPPNTFIVAISKSGETADTLAAIREAKRKGASLIGIINVVGSSISRETDAGIYNHAGPEIGVASTKNFTSQLTTLTLLALLLGRHQNLSLTEGVQA
ncbi:MAG: glutamine--fructose-6-phosphate transaminase (isomerizing), partial [Desulfobulbaceae bacterium]|nr:glutamine--fructose-6-phosphate transaminase (isomerizing) [Desulfobulbaceae bacterium]